MKTTLEKWLFAVGVFLFVWFLVPELKASADYVEIPDEVHAAALSFSYGVDNYLLFTDSDGSYYCYVECYKNSSYSVSRGPYNLETYKTGNYKFTGSGIVPPTWWSGCMGKYDGSSFSPYYYINGDSQLEVINVSSYSFYRSVTLIYSSKDVLNSDGTVFFQHPLPPTPTPTPSLQQQFQTAVMETNLEAVMNQVVGLVPLLIGFLITLISFSKGLRLLSQILHRA